VSHWPRCQKGLVCWGGGSPQYVTNPEKRLQLASSLGLTCLRVAASAAAAAAAAAVVRTRRATLYGGTLRRAWLDGCGRGLRFPPGAERDRLGLGPGPESVSWSWSWSWIPFSWLWNRWRANARAGIEPGFPPFVPVATAPASKIGFYVGYMGWLHAALLRPWTYNGLYSTVQSSTTIAACASAGRAWTQTLLPSCNVHLDPEKESIESRSMDWRKESKDSTERGRESGASLGWALRGSGNDFVFRLLPSAGLIIATVGSIGTIHFCQILRLWH
jgi:hypothetical protein